jgi:uncharacterized protein with HXXEE motif
MTFRRVAWLAPLAYAVHVAEENSQRFGDWMRVHIAPGFTTAAFVTVNTVAMTALVSLTALASASTGRSFVLPYFALASALMFWNALVHIGATVHFGVYSPGVVSAVLVYLPSFCVLARLASREGRLTKVTITTALAIGAGLHAALGIALATGVFSR